MNDLSRRGDVMIDDAVPLAPLDAVAAMLRLVVDDRYRPGTVGFDFAAAVDEVGERPKAVMRTPSVAGQDQSAGLSLHVEKIPGADSIIDHMRSIGKGITLLELGLRWDFDIDRRPVPPSRQPRHHPFEAVADDILEALNATLAPGLCREVGFRYEIRHDVPTGRRSRSMIWAECSLERIIYRDDAPAARRTDKIAALQNQLGRLAAGVNADRGLVEFDHPYLHGVKSIIVDIGCAWDIHGRRVFDRRPWMST